MKKKRRMTQQSDQFESASQEEFETNKSQLSIKKSMVRSNINKQKRLKMRLDNKVPTKEGVVH